ncbi:MAG: sulfate/molybdate ABC transporter ATP-binding protein [Alcaligenaceae bacterium]|jgi:sulfate transport system ATP-binding protein|nr:sulfate/molybdate ABC transporter ATP-binding protein [Alcaligenaceae bacterium]
MSIEIKNLNKSFGTFHALKNINLHVETGQLVSLLGPSGCGKTTLLRIIAGLEFADSGQVFLDGQDVSNESVQKRNIGFMFQHYALFRHMNVFDNVAFGLSVLPRSQRPSKKEIRERVMHLLELVQLPHLAKAFPAQLSGGQRQRIALARSLAVQPKLLLLDEPFGALDAKVRKELRQWLRNVHHELGVTSILVTHDQEEALEISDNIVLMNHGVIEQEGSGSALYHQPQTPFVTEFLGEASAFEGVVEGAQWRFNGFKLPLTNEQQQQGIHEGAAKAYVRPHQWRLSRSNDAGAMLHGFLKEVQDLGPLVRLHVLDEEQAQAVDVFVPQQIQQQAAYQKGERVSLSPEAVTLFNA